MNKNLFEKRQKITNNKKRLYRAGHMSHTTALDRPVVKYRRKKPRKVYDPLSKRLKKIIN